MYKIDFVKQIYDDLVKYTSYIKTDYDYDLKKDIWVFDNSITKNDNIRLGCYYHTNDMLTIHNDIIIDGKVVLYETWLSLNSTGYVKYFFNNYESTRLMILNNDSIVLYHPDHKYHSYPLPESFDDFFNISLQDELHFSFDELKENINLRKSHFELFEKYEIEIEFLMVHKKI